MDALDWLSQGIAVIPVKQDKTPALAWGKFRFVLPTEQQVREWITRYPSYGVICGYRGLHVIDFDDMELYSQWLLLSREEGGSYSVLTSRGIHVYLYSDADFHTTHFQGVDLLGKGAYVLGEGSLHPSGIRYVGTDAPILRVKNLARLAMEILALTGEKRRDFPPTTRHPLQPTVPSMEGGDALTSADYATTWEEAKKRAKRVPAWEVLGVVPVASGPGKGLACCPLHDDKHPSLSCDLVTGRVSCFAGCTGPRGWDACDAYQWRYRCDFVTAVRALAGR